MPLQLRRYQTAFQNLPPPLPYTTTSPPSMSTPQPNPPLPGPHLLSLPQPILERILTHAATTWHPGGSPISAWAPLTSVCRAFRCTLFDSVRRVRLSDAYSTPTHHASLPCYTSAAPHLLRTALLRCTRLRHLDLTSCDALTDTDVSSYAARGPPLTTFALSVCGRQTDASVIALARAAGPSARRVDISGCTRARHAGSPFGPAGVDHPCLALSNASLVAVATFCAGLRALAVANAPAVTDSALLAVAALEGLDSVSLTRVQGVTDGGIRALAMGRARLTSLSLFSNSEIGDAALRAIATGRATCKSLAYFGVTFAAVTDVGVGEVVSSVRSLEELQVDHCPGVSDGWMRRVEAAGGLSRVSLRNCDFALTKEGLRNLGDGGVDDYASGDGRARLEAINLGFVARVDAEMLRTLLVCAPVLEILVLDGCKNVDDAACGVIARLPRLNTLDISWCSVSAAGASTLARSKLGGRLKCLSIGPVRDDETGEAPGAEVVEGGSGDEAEGDGMEDAAVEDGEVGDENVDMAAADMQALAAAMDAVAGFGTSPSGLTAHAEGVAGQDGGPVVPTPGFNRALVQIAEKCGALEELILCGYVEPATVRWLGANTQAKVDYLYMKPSLGSAVYELDEESAGSMFT